MGHGHLARPRAGQPCRDRGRTGIGRRAEQRSSGDPLLERSRGPDPDRRRAALPLDRGRCAQEGRQHALHDRPGSEEEDLLPRRRDRVVRGGRDPGTLERQQEATEEGAQAALRVSAGGRGPATQGSRRVRGAEGDRRHRAERADRDGRQAGLRSRPGDDRSVRHECRQRRPDGRRLAGALRPLLGPLVPLEEARGSVVLRGSGRVAGDVRGHPGGLGAEPPAGVRRGNRAGARSADGQQDPADGGRQARPGQAGDRLRRHAEVQAHRRHPDGVRDQHELLRAQDRRAVLGLPPGRLVSGSGPRRPVGGCRLPAGTGLDDSGQQPALQHEVRLRLRLDARRRVRRLHARLHGQLPLRRLRRLRHRLVLPRLVRRSLLPVPLHLGLQRALRPVPRLGCRRDLEQRPVHDQHRRLRRLRLRLPVQLLGAGGFRLRSGSGLRRPPGVPAAGGLEPGRQPGRQATGGPTGHQPALDPAGHR